MFAQAKERSYHDQHSMNQFLPLAIDVFVCLHKQDDVFLHNCANAIWSFKSLEGPPLPSWLLFFIKKIQLHYKGCKHLPS
jgi:hypothetical protein